MKRIIFAFVAALTASSLFAYNPPFAGEDLYRLASPDLMTGAASASGGPLFSVTALSSAYNPALTALSQRINLDLSGTMLSTQIKMIWNSPRTQVLAALFRLD